MKRTFKLLAIVMLIALTYALGIINANAAQNVVYISANGTGDGSTPQKPLGNAPGYTIEKGSHVKNSLYRAMDKLKNTGGYIVIVGDVAIDTASSRVPTSKSEKLAPSEFKCPAFKSNVSLTVTGVYNGVDYRKQGAELIFDHEKCNTAGFFFGCTATVKDLNIKYIYDSSNKNGWGTPFMFGGHGNKLTIDKNVSVSSYDVKTGSEGDFYPMLLGGHRYSTDFANTDLTVRSGTWSTVIGGSYGLVDQSKNYGTVSGNVTLKIEGGKIGTVLGTGSLEKPSGTVLGNLSITVTGGEIEDFYVCHDYTFGGRNINVTLEKNANIQYFNYAPVSYHGNIDVLKSKITLVNSSKVVTDQKPEELPEATEPSAKPNNTPADEPSNNAEGSYNILDMMNDDRYKFIHPTILTGVIITSVLIGLGFALKNLLKHLAVGKAPQKKKESTEG